MKPSATALQTDTAYEKLRDLRLIDDRFMQVSLKGRTDCLELIAQIVLDDSALSLEEVREQETLPSVTGKSPRLDFLCKASDGRLIDVEIESTESHFHPRRARFYSSAIDLRSLPPGADYVELPDSAVIVICGEDAVGNGLLLNTFYRTSIEDNSPLGDGSVIMYVNCKAHDKTPLGLLAHDMMCQNPDEMYYEQLANCVRETKREGSTVNILVETYEEGKLEGKLEGEAIGRESAFLSLFGKGLITADVAASELGIDETSFVEKASQLGFA